MEKYYYGRKEIAKALHISEATFTRWNNKGVFKGCLVALGRTLILDLEKFMDKNIK